MPKLDGLKAELDIIKFWLGIVVATFLAIGAWLVNNYQTANNLLIFSAIIVLSSLFCAIILLSQKMKRIAKEIKNS